MWPLRAGFQLLDAVDDGFRIITPDLDISAGGFCIIINNFVLFVDDVDYEILDGLVSQIIYV